MDSGTVTFLNQNITTSPGTFLMGTGNFSRKQTRYIAKYRNAFTDGFTLEAMAGLNDTPEASPILPAGDATNSGGGGRF